MKDFLSKLSIIGGLLTLTWVIAELLMIYRHSELIDKVDDFDSRTSFAELQVAKIKTELEKANIEIRRLEKFEELVKLEEIKKKKYNPIGAVDLDKTTGNIVTINDLTSNREGMPVSYQIHFNYNKHRGLLSYTGTMLEIYSSDQKIKEIEIMFGEYTYFSFNEVNYRAKLFRGRESYGPIIRLDSDKKVSVQN